MKTKILLIITITLSVLFVDAQTTTAFRKNYDQALFDLPGNIVEGLTANTYVMAGTNLSFLPIYGTVSELNDTGGINWSFRYSDASIGFQLNDIKKVQSANQYIACGGSESNSAVFMVLDAAGVVVISKKFNINEANSAWFNRVIKASDGGYVAVGYVTGYDPDGAGPEIDFNPINYTDANGDPQTEYIGSPLIVKLDAAGNHVWHKVFRYYIGANVPANRIYNDASFVDVVEVSDGYVAVGSYDVNQHLSNTNSDGDDATPTDAIILKTNTSGTITYHKQIDNPDSSPSQNSQYLSAVNTTSTGDLIMGGYENSKELIQKYVGPGGFSQTFSRLFTYPGLASVVDVSQIYEVNGSTDLATMAMYIQPTGFVFSNSIHRVNPTATTNVFAKRYDFNLISILPRGGKTSDNGYISMSMTAGGTNYDYHVIKTDPTGDTPLTGCPPTSFSPTPSSGPTTSSDPSFNVWSGTPGSNTLTIVRSSISPTVSYVCTKTTCIPPLEATTVTATPSTICSGESSSITASGPSSGVSYQVWTAATGGTNLGTTPLSVSPTSNTTYYIQTVSNSDGSCVSATRVPILVTVTPSTTPTFTAVAPICSGDALSPLPTTSNNGVTGTWSPALDNTTTTTYTFTPTAGQCATTTTMSITVDTNVIPTFTAISPICSGDALSPLPTTSNNGITGTWSPALDNTTTTTYTFTPTAGQCATTTTMSITVDTNVIPTFTAVSPICSGDALSPLPTTSNNGITGTWSPALDNTTTTTYTFTPTAGQCATTTTMSITVDTNVIPTFAAVSPICSGDALSPLPTTSNNGITGTWSPALDNTTTTTYTFTPTAGQCATTTTMSITVDTNVIPTFAAVSSICSGDALSPLPTTSNNGITGTWSPALDNTTTTTYTFTPTAGQCATTNTLSITVDSNITPTFAVVAPICTGDALSPLPTTSNNGITGAWSPALDNTTTTTYTFTPTAGQCATTTTLTITVNSSPATPTFTAVAPICSGDALAPLPTTSNNGITGTWSPALDNTTTTTYTFTPTAGQCATTTTLTITVNSSPATPTFTAVAPICSGDALAPLPTTSNNGITGTWSPTLDNTTTTTYTFTPTSGQCATTTTLTITVNSSPATPTFTAVAPICSGDALAPLPTTSNNGITGTWSPTLDNTTTTTYTFTPTAGQCATTTTMSITVDTNVIPTFTAVSPICSGDALSPLPTTSNNGITGTWSPALDNTTTTTYTFTPTAGQCATTTTLTITVTVPTVPVFTAVSAICSGDALTPLPTTSNNGVTGTWSPALDNTTTTTYTFTPTSGQCATTTTMTITVSSPPVAAITGTSSICFGQTATLTASGGNSYVWSTGEVTPSITSTPSDTITYWVTASIGSCSDSDTITVNVIQNPNVIVSPAISTTIVQGQTVELTASGASSYTWTPSEGLSCINCPVTIASPEITTVYCATTVVDGCPDTTCVIVNVDIICGELFVPSAFSPNGDGVNDCLSVYNNCIESMDFKVFSRWGEVVYQSIDVNDCWDGSFKGTPLNTAVFVYKLDAVLLNGEEVKLKGNVSLIK
ncbi:MAG: gliding motility-associated C-terminal domain-containing protein [Flavobacteriales bacterium]